MKTLLAALLVLSSSALASTDGQENSYSGPPLDKCKPGKRIDTDAVVLRDVDGDTVDVKTKTGSYSIRMLGIDTPETHFMGHSQGEWGERAAEQLARLAPVGSRVKLDLADEPCDKYGRVLAHIFIGKVHVNAEMVKNGMAV
ncbi:MAG TPA: thermonuclease family protein, partial [Bdellovibrionota bacterium]